MLSDYTAGYSEEDNLGEVIYVQYGMLPLTPLFPRYTSQEPVSAIEVEGGQ